MSRSREMRHVLCWIAALAATACGGSSADRSTIGREQDFTEVRAEGPSAATYASGAEHGDAVVGGSAAALVQRAVEGAARAHEMPLEGDPRLARLAQWVVERLGPDGEPPPNEVIEFFARHLGLVEPVPHVMVLGQPADTLEAGLTSSVGQFMDRQTYNRWGAALTEDRGLTVAVVLLSWRWVELEPIARRVEPGASLVLRGQLLGDHRNPSVVVAPPDGPVRRLPAGAGPAFDVRVPLASAGMHRVEVIGRGPHGDTVIANFPVYAGEDPPSTLRYAAAGAASADVDGVRRELLSLLNETRREAGLTPLREHQGLAEVATAHARDMVEHEFIGHTSPTTGSPADRVRGAQIHTGLVLENIGRGYSAAEIHRGLTESPGHRANLINADVTHVGIGVVAEQEGDRSAFVATQVFVRMAERMDLTNAGPRLLEQINRARSARGAPPLALEEHLSQAAQQAAEEFFSDPTRTQQDTVDDASASLRRFAIAYRRIGGVMAVVAALDEAAALEPTLDADVRVAGIGVAQGTRPDTGPNGIAVVIILAWPR